VIRMKLFAFILAFSMLYSTVVPCHAGEHEHGESCTHHHGHHDHDNPEDNDENGDDHPCSPFCGFHSSVNSPASSPLIISENIYFTESVEKVFIYTPTYFYLQEFSIWNPPKA